MNSCREINQQDNQAYSCLHQTDHILLKAPIHSFSTYKSSSLRNRKYLHVYIYNNKTLLMAVSCNDRTEKNHGL